MSMVSGIHGIFGSTSLMIEPDLEDNNLRGIIHRLADDQQVFKLVSDERMRCEHHKNNYTKLKIEFEKISHERRLIQSDLSSLQLEHNDLKDTSAKALSQMESVISELKSQLEYLHTQLPTKAHELQMRNDIFLQADSKWRTRLANCLAEVESLKSSKANVASENECLRSDLSRLTTQVAQEKQGLEILHKKKFGKLKEGYDSLKKDYDPKIMDLEHSLNKVNLECTSLRKKWSSLNDENGNLAQRLRQKDEKIRNLKEQLYRSSSDLSSKEAKLVLELDKVEMMLEETNRKFEEEKRKCWELTSMANSMKQDLIRSQDEQIEAVLDNEASMSELKIRHAEQRIQLESELDHYRKVSEAKDNAILNLRADLDGLKMRHELKIKSITEEMLTLRLENAKREIELDAKVTEYRHNLEEVNGDIRKKEDVTRKKLNSVDRSDSNKLRTSSSVGSRAMDRQTIPKDLKMKEDSGQRIIKASDGSVKEGKQKTACDSNVDKTEDSVISLEPQIGYGEVQNHIVSEMVDIEPIETKDSMKEKDSRISSKQCDGEITQTGNYIDKKNNTTSAHDSCKNSENSKIALKGSNLGDENLTTDKKLVKHIGDSSLKEFETIQGDLEERSRQINLRRATYEDIRRKYEDLKGKHTKFSGLMKRSPLSFEND